MTSLIKMLTTLSWELQKVGFNKNKNNATFTIILQQTQCDKLLLILIWTQYWYYFFEKWYVYNNFTTFLQQILTDRLLQVVIVGLKK